MFRTSRIGKIALAAAFVAASGGAALGLTSIASASLGNSSKATTAQGDAPVVMMADVEIQNAAGAVVKSDRFASDTLATALGMTPEELREALQSGKTIAQIAEEQGKSLDDVKDAMIAGFEKHLDEHVADGTLTREQADLRLEGFTSRLDQIVQKAGPLRGGPGGRDGHGRHGRGARFMGESLAKALDMTVDELKTELMSGKTIAQIAEAQKVDIDDVKKALVADAKTHLAEEVASGKHTQAEADAKLAEFESRLDDMVNKVRPPKGDHDHGGDHDRDGASGSGASVPA